MIKKFYFSVILFVVLLGFMAPVLTVFAQTAADREYTVLAPLPGTTIKENCVAGDPECKTTLAKYLPGLFKLLVGLAAAAAVFRIVWGGFLYMSSDALQGKEDGRTMIWNSIKGLVLIIGAWLILYTINPGLLELRLNIETIEISGPPSSANGGILSGSGTPGRAMTQAEIDESNAMREALEKVGIYTYTGPCTKGQTRGCVNLNGLTQTTQSGLDALTKMLAQNGVARFITLTGGTESGHSSTGGHPTGDSVDIGRSANSANYTALSNFIISRGGTPVPTSYGNLYTIQINGRSVTFLDENDHWHVTFK